MATFKHVIWVPFTIDRPAGPIQPPTEDWVRQRFRLFRDYTLKSIENQSLITNLEVWLICGQRFKSITQSLAIGSSDKVHFVHDDGKERLSKIDTDFLVQSRIDSDDLYHKDAVYEINKFAQDRAKPNAVVAGVFRESLVWARLQGFIASHIKMCQPPPFTTKIFPRKVYSNWDEYYRLTFIQHGVATERVFKLIPMTANMVCVVKHGTNYSCVKRGRNPARVEKDSPEYKELVLMDVPADVERAMSFYGVSQKAVRKRPECVYVEKQYKTDTSVKD